MNFIQCVKNIKNNPWYVFCSLAGHNFFNWLPDELYLKLMYRGMMGKKLDLKKPQTFNEKLQWLKIHDRKPEYTQMVDKYEAKKYVASIIGNQYIIPTLGIWDKFDDIDFNKLPNQFVLKCTHDSGGLVVCKDKNSIDILKIKKKINQCLKHNFYYIVREWPYKNVKPRIIAEKYMGDGIKSEGLIDYKFYCFDGDPRYLYVSKGMDNHETAQISFFDMEFKKAPFGRSDYLELKEKPLVPVHFKEMIDIAKKLSYNHSFLRVDLYEIDNRVYFSELTFSPCAGLMPFQPPEYDRVLGDMLKLN